MNQLDEIALQLRRIIDLLETLASKDNPRSSLGYETILHQVKGKSSDPQRRPTIARVVYENQDKSIAEIGEILKRAGCYSPSTTTHDMTILKWLKKRRDSQ